MTPICWLAALAPSDSDTGVALAGSRPAILIRKGQGRRTRLRGVSRRENASCAILDRTCAQRTELKPSSLSERGSFSAGRIDDKLVPCLSYSSELIAGSENDGSQVQDG